MLVVDPDLLELTRKTRIVIGLFYGNEETSSWERHWENWYFIISWETIWNIWGALPMHMTSSNHLLLNLRKAYLIVIVIYKLLKHHVKAKRMAPAYWWVLPSNQRGCPEDSPWEVHVGFPEGQRRQSSCQGGCHLWEEWEDTGWGRIEKRSDDTSVLSGNLVVIDKGSGRRW